MKKAIFWAVIRQRGYGQGYYEILEVTTEKGHQVYGRDVDGASTHVAHRDVLKRCTSRPEAEEVLVAAEQIRTKHRSGIAAARRALVEAESLERRELDALVA